MAFERAIKFSIALFLTALALIFYGPAARGQILTEPSDAQLAAMRASVLPIATVDTGERFCSAVVIAPDVALTAAHCVARGTPKGALEQGGKLLPIAGVQIDRDRDLATIRVPGIVCPCAVLAPRANYEIGMTVAAVGYPMGGENAMTLGYFIGRIQIFAAGTEINVTVAT